MPQVHYTEEQLEELKRREAFRKFFQMAGVYWFLYTVIPAILNFFYGGVAFCARKFQECVGGQLLELYRVAWQIWSLITDLSHMISLVCGTLLALFSTCIPPLFSFLLMWATFYNFEGNMCSMHQSESRSLSPRVAHSCDVDAVRQDFDMIVYLRVVMGMVLCLVWIISKIEFGQSKTVRNQVNSFLYHFFILLQLFYLFQIFQIYSNRNQHETTGRELSQHLSYVDVLNPPSTVPWKSSVTRHLVDALFSAFHVSLQQVEQFLSSITLIRLICTHMPPCLLEFMRECVYMGLDLAQQFSVYCGQKYVVNCMGSKFWEMFFLFGIPNLVLWTKICRSTTESADITVVPSDSAPAGTPDADAAAAAPIGDVHHGDQ